MTYKNGDVYEGQWFNNLKNGKGHMKYSNGEKQKGKWLNGIFEKGQYITQSGLIIEQSNNTN